MEPTTEPVTISGVKDKLVGLDSWLRAAAKSDAHYDDKAIETLIPAMLRRWERRTQFRIDPIQVVAFPDGTYDNQTNNTDINEVMELYIDDAYPYYNWEAQAFLTYRLRWRPILTIQRVRLMLDPNQVVYEVPNEWIRFDRFSGQFSLMPVVGAAQVIGSSAMAALSMIFGYKDYIPQLTAFDYQAGLPNKAAGFAYDWWTTHEWADLVRVLEEWCAWAVLQDISELYDAGRMSKTISGDGLSQSVSYERFKRRADQLLQSVESFRADFAPQQTPFLLSAV